MSKRRIGCGEDVCLDRTSVPVGMDPLQTFGGKELSAQSGRHDLIGRGLRAVHGDCLFPQLQEFGSVDDGGDLVFGSAEVSQTEVLAIRLFTNERLHPLPHELLRQAVQVDP
jgi:hypothetical protein